MHQANPSSAAEVARSGLATRRRIIDAAAARFARQSFEETGLREIAADAGVDVAHVHRSFGSKEKLFEEALRQSLGVRWFGSLSEKGLAQTLHSHCFDRSIGTGIENVNGMDIATRSLASPKARAVLRAFIVDDFLRPLTVATGHRNAQRLAVATALVAGFRLLRNVLELDALSSEFDEALRAITGDVIAAALDGIEEGG